MYAIHVPGEQRRRVSGGPYAAALLLLLCVLAIHLLLMASPTHASTGGTRTDYGAGQLVNSPGTVALAAPGEHDSTAPHGASDGMESHCRVEPAPVREGKASAAVAAIGCVYLPRIVSVTGAPSLVGAAMPASRPPTRALLQVFLN